jgi:hypothetical protein
VKHFTSSTDRSHCHFVVAVWRAKRAESAL